MGFSCCPHRCYVDSADGWLLMIAGSIFISPERLHGAWAMGFFGVLIFLSGANNSRPVIHVIPHVFRQIYRFSRKQNFFTVILSAYRSIQNPARSPHLWIFPIHRLSHSHHIRVTSLFHYCTLRLKVKTHINLLSFNLYSSIVYCLTVMAALLTVTGVKLS